MMTDEFDMPKPPGWGEKVIPKEIIENWVSTEAIATRRLQRTCTAKEFALRSRVYVRRHPQLGNVVAGKARRLLTRFSARSESHLFDEGTVAHIVDLPNNPLRNCDDVPAWCGEHVRGHQKWSSLRSHATCHHCIKAALDIRIGSVIGIRHRRAEEQPMKVFAQDIQDGSRAPTQENLHAYVFHSRFYPVDFPDASTAARENLWDVRGADATAFDH